MKASCLKYFLILVLLYLGFFLVLPTQVGICEQGHTFGVICHDETIYFAGYRIITRELPGTMNDLTTLIVFGLPLILSGIATSLLFVVRKNKL